jgi:omega-6 fatty acid desaturase (delta-12 desaturase)
MTTDTARRPFWADSLAPYARPRTGRALLEIATSAGAYLALCVLMYLCLSVSALLVLVLALPSAGFLVRTFTTFHDCTHGSLLPSRRANAWVGAVLGLLVLAPFRRWRHDHAVHHASSGDLERRGVGDLPTLTVREYQGRTRGARAAYRGIRNPLVMFGLGPVFAMIIGPRIATRAQRPRMRRSVLLTDAALAAVVVAICLVIGWQSFLLIWAPAALLAGSTGIWLFYVQHQFEDAYWESSEQWSYADAALRGSSYLKLPQPLQFFTRNIGLHHIHHLNAKIPGYNLQRAHDENPIFADVPTLSLGQGLRAVGLKLWDEDRQRLVSFAEARRARSQSTRLATEASVG